MIGPTCRRVATRRKRAALTLVAAILGGLQPLGAQADVVLTGGKVFTGDPARPWAEAIAIRGARILAVGANADIARLARPGARFIELGGRTVVPGFDDAHAHVGGSIRGARIVVDPSP